MIPVLYEKCEVPPELSYYFFLDYNRASKLWNFWEKLRDSIQGPELSDKVTKVVKSSPVKSTNEYWISRTHFEEKQEEPGSSQKEPEPEPETIKISNKKKNVYKIIKSSFGRAIKNSSQDLVEKSNSKHSGSLLSNLSSFMSSDNVILDNLENSSSFEGQEDSNESKKIKKKKWFKKKNLEPLLS